MSNYNTRRNSASSQVMDDKGQSPSASAQAKKEAKCGTCSSTCKETEKILLCRVCDRYFHASCQSVDDDEYKVINRNRSKAAPSTFWFCNSSCNIFADKFMCSMMEMKKGIDSLRKDVDSLSGTVQSINGRVSNVERGIFTEPHAEQVRKLAREEIETENNERLTDDERAEILDDKISDAVSAAVREVNERQYRKKSVLIFGAPMSKAKNIKARVDHDKTFFDNLCTNGLNIRNKLNPQKIVRLGKKDDEVRPLKVFFESPHAASEILRSSSNLKDKEEFNDVSISADKTPLERRERKKLVALRDQRQRMSDEQEDGIKWVIKGTRLVKENKEVVQELEEDANRSHVEGLN